MSRNGEGSRSPRPTDTLEEFERLLRLGLGRAVLFLRGHDAAPYREAIVRACVQDLGYDAQLESGRATYLFDVIEATHDEASFVEPVSTALLTAAEHWSMVQLFDLAALLAKAGHTLARDAVYSRFDRNDASGSFDGAEALVELDELPGLLHVADHVGQAVLTRSDVDVDPHVLWFAQERFGKETVERAMTEAAASNSAVAAYIQALRADREQQAKRTPGHQSHLETASYPELRAAIFAQGSRALGAVVLDRWGRQADEPDLVSAATDLLAETDDDRLVSYLRIFRKRAFPIDPGPLLPLVRHPSRRVSAAAFTTLSLVTDPRIRRLALEILDDESVTGFQRGCAADLLVRNAAPGDVALLGGLLARRQDVDELHGLGFGLLDWLAAQPAPDAASALVAIYEYDPCSLCRERAVERLHEINALPDWLVEECRYDANIDLRRSVDSWHLTR